MSGKLEETVEDVAMRPEHYRFKHYIDGSIVYIVATVAQAKHSTKAVNNPTGRTTVKNMVIGRIQNHDWWA